MRIFMEKSLKASGAPPNVTTLSRSFLALSAFYYYRKKK